MTNNKFYLVLLLLLAGFVQVKAQGKMAWIDENYVVQQMPAYAKVEAQMKAYSESVQKELTSKQEELQKLVKEIQEQTNIVIRDAKQKKAQDLSQLIQQMQQTIQVEYQDTLSKKLAPLYEELQGALKTVQASNGNIYVIRREALAYVEEANNISDMVLKQLGVTPKEPVAGRGNLKASNKMGVINESYVLQQMPGFKKAQSDLKLYGDKLQENIQGIQLEAQKILQQLEDPDIPDARRKELEGKIQEIQQRFQKAQADAQQQYTKKQNDLLKPIYDKMQSNVEQYAKSKGYTFVMKIEASLLEPEEHNISDAVLQQMGVTPVANNE